MARLPHQGGDDGVWGDILNDFLAVSLKSDGTLKDNIVGQQQLSSSSVYNSNIASVAASKVTGLAQVATAGTYASLSGSRNHAKVIHGSDSTVPRPTSDYVLWEGSVEPDNWIDGDDWNET